MSLPLLCLFVLDLRIIYFNTRNLITTFFSNQTKKKSKINTSSAGMRTCLILSNQKKEKKKNPFLVIFVILFLISSSDVTTNRTKLFTQSTMLVFVFYLRNKFSIVLKKATKELHNSFESMSIEMKYRIFGVIFSFMAIKLSHTLRER